MIFIYCFLLHYNSTKMIINNTQKQFVDLYLHVLVVVHNTHEKKKLFAAIRVLALLIIIYDVSTL